MSKTRTSSVYAKNQKEAIKKLRAKMLPEWRKKVVAEKVKLVSSKKEYEVTFRLKKKGKKKQ